MYRPESTFDDLRKNKALTDTTLRERRKKAPKQKLVLAYKLYPDREITPNQSQVTNFKSPEEIQKLLQEAEEEAYQDRFEKLKHHICADKPKELWHKKCKNCGSILKDRKGKKGKVLHFVPTCNNPFCWDETCIEKRLKIAKQMYKIYFNAYPHWQTKRGNKWGHHVLGFKRQSLPTKKELLFMFKQVNKFLDAWREKFGIRIKGVGVRDVSYNKHKPGEEFYIHFHYYLRPFPIPKVKEEVKSNKEPPNKLIDNPNYRFREAFDAVNKELGKQVKQSLKKEKPKTNFSRYLSAVEKLGKEFGLVYSWKNKKGWYKPGWSGVNYLSKRHAGLFEHKKNKTNWVYHDVLSLEEYFDSFHATQRFYHVGFSKKENKFLKKVVKKMLQREALELTSNVAERFQRNKCKECGHNKFSIEKSKEAPDNQSKPPPWNTYKAQENPEDLGGIIKVFKEHRLNQTKQATGGTHEQNNCFDG